jgi:hypothetical protein
VIEKFRQGYEKSFLLNSKLMVKFPQKLIQNVKSQKLLWRVVHKIRKTSYFLHCLVENFFGRYAYDNKKIAINAIF